MRGESTNESDSMWSEINAGIYLSECPTVLTTGTTFRLIIQLVAAIPIDNNIELAEAIGKFNRSKKAEGCREMVGGGVG